MAALTVLGKKTIELFWPTRTWIFFAKTMGRSWIRLMMAVLAENMMNSVLAK